MSETEMNLNEMTAWWFCGELLGTRLLANDENLSSILRDTMRRRLADLMDNWVVDED
jgi:hypothetical protein